MKRIAPLFLLPLLLAACGQPSTPGPAAQLRNSATLGHGGVAYLDTQAAYDAQVMADLNRLSAQGAQAKVYLNVLPLAKTEDSVRAYVKSSFATPVTCSVDWGDSSASTSVASPTVKSVETKDHAYATFGTYTITTTCLNDATVVGTQSLTVQAGKKVTAVTLDFENPSVADQNFSIYPNGYQEKGYEFTIDPAGESEYAQVTQLGKGLAYGFANNLPSQAIFANDNRNKLVMKSILPSSTFTLTSFEYQRLEPNASSNFILNGYKLNGDVLSIILPDSGNQIQAYQLDSSWSDLTKVTWSNDEQNGNWMMVDNIHVSK